MKLTKLTKSIIAVTCSIAMVVAGFMFLPAQKASAEPDPYAGQVWKDATDGSNYKICIVDQTTTDEFTGVFQVEGSSLYIAASASIIKPNYVKVTLNGAELTPWPGAYFRFNIADLTQDFDNIITVDDAVGGKYTLVLRAGTPAYDTTTEDPSATTPEPTTLNPDDPYAAETWKSATDGHDWKICIVGQNSTAEFSGVFQQEGDNVFIAGSAAIIKPDYKKITINGTEITTWAGAYFRLPLSEMDLTDADNTILVDDAVGGHYTVILRAGTPDYTGFYNVADYKPEGGAVTYPTKEDKIFAGWFTDSTCTTPYTATTGYAYAKFIDEKVLTVKFQTANDGSAVRFVSTIDNCLDYQSVGFKFTGTYGDAAITEKTKTVNSVFEKISGDGHEYIPSTAFNNDDSAYFFTYTVRGMTDASTASTWDVTPFFVTPDGTTVEGTANTYPVS
ncbi:MAG: hypothetical protein K6E58_00685 [Eubacterium sp.]|nr:hypothetical protein [Eubacterium sp.]